MLGQLKNRTTFLTSPITEYHVTWWIPKAGPLDPAKAEKERGSFTLRHIHRDEVAPVAEDRIRREIDGCYDGADIVGFFYLVYPLDETATGGPAQ